MAEERCTIGPERRPLGWVLRRHALRWPKVVVWKDRRLAGLAIAGLLAAWAVVLTVAGLASLVLAVRAPHDASPNGTPALLLAAGGVTALISLVAWATVLGRASGARFALKVVQVAAALVALAGALWGLLAKEPRRTPFILAVVVAALLASLAARVLATREAVRDRPRMARKTRIARTG
jgi:hypothetical protein